ncbi:MAG: methyltransferase domain-containing protein [Solirubrobacteraceae bacterium]
MTDEMLELARANTAQAGMRNVEFVQGYIEQIPLPDESVDVIVSNCVLNLSGEKAKGFLEAARVLRPVERLAVSDVIASPEINETTRADLAAYTGCVAGALTEEEFHAGLQAAGFVEIEIRETHRVHELASSAIVRTPKPARGAVRAARGPGRSLSTCAPAITPDHDAGVVGQLSTLDRLLPVWILVAMGVGLGLGALLPGLNGSLSSVQVTGTSLPIAIGLLLMMSPVLARGRRLPWFRPTGQLYHLDRPVSEIAPTSFWR